MARPPQPYPLKLDAEVSIAGTVLTIRSNATTFQHRLPREGAEWVWGDVLGDPAERNAKVIVAAAVQMTPRAVEIVIGEGPQKWVLAMVLHPGNRGILEERQRSVNANGGQRPAWKEIVF